MKKSKLKFVTVAGIIVAVFAKMIWDDGSYVTEVREMKNKSERNSEQFIEEIKALNRRSEFRVSLFDVMNPFLENKIEKMRKYYNLAYAEIFRNYGLYTDNLYDELDEIWKEAHEKFKLNPWLLMIGQPYMVAKGRWDYYKKRALELATAKSNQDA